jgi:hypothetical protein
METPKDNSFAEPKKPHARHLLRWVLVLAILLAGTVALFYAFENWRGNRAWNQFRQAVETRGELLEFVVPATRHQPKDPGSESPFAKELADFYRTPDRSNPLFKPPNSQTSNRQFEDLVTWAEAFTAIRLGQTNQQFELGTGDTNASARFDAAVIVLNTLAPQAPFMDK